MNLSREQKLITDYPMVIGSTITCPPDHELVVQKSVAQNVNDVYRILRPGESFTHTYLDQLTALLVDFRLRALLLEEKFITQEREDILISLNATYKVYDSAVVIQQEDPVKQLQDIISVTLSRVINQHPFTDISEDIIERAILEKNSHELGLRILHVQVLSLQNWPSYLLQEKVARQTYQLRELEDFWRSLKDRDRLVDLRLDAAVPDKVMIYRPFLLAVTVRQPQSPVLNEEDLKKTATADLHVVWPHSEGFIRLLIDVSAPDCITIARDHLTFRLNRDQDSPIFYFPLTPKREGLITIIITLLYDNDGIASSRLKTTSYSEVIGEVHIQTQTSMNTFSKEQHFIERELDILNRRLQHLQIAKSYKGINTEPEVLMEIEDIEKEMYRLRDQMEKYRY